MRDGELYLVNFNHLLHFSCYISTCPCPLQIVATAYAVHIKQLAAKVKAPGWILDSNVRTSISFVHMPPAHTCANSAPLGLFTETAVCFIERVRLLQSSSVNSLPFCQEILLICVSVQEEAYCLKSPLSISFNERLSAVVLLLSFMYPLSSSSLKAGKKSIITSTL